IVARIDPQIFTPTPTFTGTPPTATGTRTPMRTPTSTNSATPLGTPGCGPSWSLVTPVPTATDFINRLNAAAALSDNDVWAAGYARGSGPMTRSLVEHWDGAQWSILPSPNPGSDENRVNAMAAVSPQDVWAVGYFY